MPRLNTLIGAFSHGEISPLLFGRMETTMYKRGVARLRNMIPNERGPAISRVGYSHNNRFPGETNVKMHSFYVAQNHGFVCAFFENLLSMVFDAHDSYGANLVSNGDFENGLVGWNNTSTAPATVIVTDEIALFTPTRTATKVAEITQVVVIPDAGATYDFRVIGSFNGPTAQEAVLFKIGTAPGLDDIASCVHFGNEKFHQENIAAPGVTTLYFTFTALDWSNDVGVGITTSAIDQILFRVLMPPVTTVNIVTTYAAEDIDNLKFKMVPGENKAYITHNNYPPAELIYDPLIPSFTLQDIVFTAQPAFWSTGNYPALVEFHQGRSWWAGYSDDPETFNASKSALYTDFSVTVPLVADDAMEFTLSKKGIIRWITSAKNLLVGTEFGEFVIEANNVVIVHDDIQVNLQSAHGSSQVTPQLIGVECAFIPMDNRQVRSMGYKWKESGWVADDISMHGHHLFTSNIVQTTVSKNPDQILWYVLAEGSVVGCSYEAASESERRILGWHKHNAYGSIKSITPLETAGNSILWIATHVVVEGVDEIHIGHMDTDFDSPPLMMDSAVLQSSGVATDTLTGLEHLEGVEVTVLLDGSLYGTEVVANGEVTLTKEGFSFITGLPFTAELTTLPVRFYASDSGYYHPMKRHNKIFVQLLDSAIPLINGTRPPDRSPSTPFNTVQPLTSKLVQVANAGWDDAAQIEIVQNLPFPLTVIAIAGEMAMEQV